MNILNKNLPNLTKHLNELSKQINNKYDLDTWANPQTKTIWLSVCYKSLADSYDIEMSFNQTLEFYNELIINNKTKNNAQKTTNPRLTNVIGMDIIFNYLLNILKQ